MSREPTLRRFMSPDHLAHNKNLSSFDFFSNHLPCSYRLQKMICVRLVVTHFLDRSDLVACVRVSKAWNKFFEPLLYKSVDMTGSLRPSQDVVQRHGADIESLTVQLHALPSCQLPFSVWYTWNKHEKRATKHVLFPNISSLDLKVCLVLKDVMAWVGQCPRLTFLTLSLGGKSLLDAAEPDLDWSPLRESLQLSKLQISDTHGKALEQSQLTRILDNCPRYQMKELTLSSQSVGAMALHTLGERFLETMVTLDISECVVPDWISQRILCSSPRLVVFKSQLLSVDCMFSEVKGGKADVQHDFHSEWVCLGLKTLGFVQVLWSEDESRNCKALEQLWALVELEVLKIEYMNSSWWPRGEFDRGQLERNPTSRWMITSWPKLQHYSRRMLP